MVHGTTQEIRRGVLEVVAVAGRVAGKARIIPFGINVGVCIPVTKIGFDEGHGRCAAGYVISLTGKCGSMKHHIVVAGFGFDVLYISFQLQCISSHPLKVKRQILNQGIGLFYTRIKLVGIAKLRATAAFP